MTSYKSQTPRYGSKSATTPTIYISISATKIAQTDKAILVKVVTDFNTELECWLPLSQIRAIHKPLDSNEMTLEVAEWLLKTKGII